MNLSEIENYSIFLFESEIHDCVMDSRHISPDIKTLYTVCSPCLQKT